MKKAVFLGLFLIGLSLSVAAQPGPPNNPVPFGFLEVLLLGGAAYGAYEVKKNAKKQ